MIGTIIMEVCEAEMRSALEYYFNSDLFFSKHKCAVVNVRQRTNKRFVITFKGQPEPSVKEKVNGTTNKV